MRVLIPIDWSENAERAFDWYLHHMHNRDNTVVLAHFLGSPNEKDLHEKEVKMMELQESYENRLLQRKVTYRWLTGTGGTPGDFIVKAALDEDVGMILMGCRGLGKIKKVLLGSVSDCVLNKSHVPVLICKLP